MGVTFAIVELPSNLKGENIRIQLPSIERVFKIGYIVVTIFGNYNVRTAFFYVRKSQFG